MLAGENRSAVFDFPDPEIRVVPNAKDTYRKLIRLRENRKRLDARISRLVEKLEGKKFNWQGCSAQRKRT